jgi:uncharacterized protein
MSELIDNREQRVRKLGEVIQHLHEGRPPAEVKGRLAALVHECGTSELASMEHDLVAAGVPAQRMLKMCDLHAQVVRETQDAPPEAPVPPGHPVDTFRRENAALATATGALRAALAAVAAPDASEDAAVDAKRVLECRRLFNALMDVDKHYQRKEHLLFSCLERHGITGPSTMMWAKDDEVRALLATLGAALQRDGRTVGDWRAIAHTVAERALAAVEDMIFREQRILLPMALERLTPGEWGEIWSQSPEFGYCLVDPQQGYEPPAPGVTGERTETSRRTDAASGPASRGTGAIVFPSGALSLAQLQAIFSTLPVDVTFVDADDRVRFFSEGRTRVFARPRAVIGRRVQHCHPPASVDTVDRILDDFRAGRQDVAEFWIEMRGRFVHIRYFAVRDDRGTYLGTLEVTQDLTRERGLQGERRLLQYGSATPAGR